MDLGVYDAYVMIRRKKLTICTPVDSNIQVDELKNMVGRIIKESPKNLQFIFEDKILDETKSLSDYGISYDITNPMIIGLSLKMENGEFEPLEITPYSEPPPSEDFS